MSDSDSEFRGESDSGDNLDEGQSFQNILRNNNVAFDKNLKVKPCFIQGIFRK
jgi:hypothetical protein